MSISSPSGENPSESNSLPLRWKRGRQRAALSALAIITLFTGALQAQSRADQFDWLWLRARFTMREWLHNRFSSQPISAPVDSQIAIVEIDDKTSNAEGWQDLPLIMLGDKMAKAIDHLNQSGARLIALDWIQTLPTKNDEVLGAAISRSKNVVFVKFIRPYGGYALPTAALLYSAPNAWQGADENLGFAELAASDGIQYSFLPTLPNNNGKPDYSFAARIAHNSGYKIDRDLPIRSDGSLLINYADNAGQRGKRSPFLRASLVDVANSTKPDPRFKDKIVIIGVSYKGNNDFHFIPFAGLDSGLNFTTSRKIPGVELQAHALETLIQNKAIREPDGLLVWLMSAFLGAIGVWLYATGSWVRAARTLGILVVGWIAFSFSLFLADNYALPIVAPLLSLVVGCALMGGYRAFSEERERGQVMKIWGRYQDPTLIRELLENPDLRSGQGREAMVTVLFADLKNFTQTVEPLPPAQALEALNKYLAMFANVIRDHGGIVDKYLGDGLMAQWGAPVSRPDHATAAVKACLEIQNRIGQLTEELKKTGQVTFEARLTLHTGLVIAGPLGADEKLEYTIIGDTVNVTSRLQETAKAMDSNFLISEMTCAAMACLVKVGRETTVSIRGRKAPLRVFEILGEEAV